MTPTPSQASIETDGISPKVPVQALVTLLVAAVAYFGVELSEEVSAALAVLIGAAAAYFAPAASTRRVSA